MEKYTDTIAAIATSLGQAALSVVRISGPDTPRIIERIFRKGRDLKRVSYLEEKRVHYGFIVDPESEEIQDEVTLIYYKGPKSYTTEDMAEIICHGGYVSPRKVLKSILKAGARLAEPGEFTKRAFLGGRVDLTEAEAVLEVIHAKGERAHKAAISQLSGGLKKRIESIAQWLRELLMLIEACIDFPEEEIEYLNPEEIEHRLIQAKTEIEELIQQYQTSSRIKEGIPIAIVGKPNVGKSSLLNALLKEERAIVTEIPGTTRDTIEEEMSIKGIPIRIIDTAGIRHTEDPVERIGVERSIEKLKVAEVVLLVVDTSKALDDEDRYIASLVREKKHILVLNKIDLAPEVQAKDITAQLQIEPVEIVKTSAKLHTGIGELQDAIIGATAVSLKEAEFLVNERHYDVLIKARDALERCIETVRTGLTNEFIAIDLKEALNRLGEITGETTTDDILNMIFSRFCIGK